MKASSKNYKKEKKLQQKGCNALCCGCRTSVSSSSSSEKTEESSHSSRRYASISTLAHAMVQERLDQMIRERRESSRVDERRRQRNRNERRSSSSTKFVVMLAMEKCSYDPREDFRESMVEMIMENRIKETKDLRSLLNYYMSMNSEEYHRVILEVFHEVCASLFRRCRSH